MSDIMPRQVLEEIPKNGGAWGIVDVGRAGGGGISRLCSASSIAQNCDIQIACASEMYPACGDRTWRHRACRCRILKKRSSSRTPYPTQCHHRWPPPHCCYPSPRNATPAHRAHRRHRIDCNTLLECKGYGPVAKELWSVRRGAQCFAHRLWDRSHHDC